MKKKISVTKLMVFVLLLVVAGCNKTQVSTSGDTVPEDNAGVGDNVSGGDNTPLPLPSEPEPVEKGRVADTIKQLEKEGKYPVLDRSDTLLGADANNNGIRDDIENYINSLQEVKPNQKNALMQLAYSLNYSLSPECLPTEKDCIIRAMEMFDRAGNCTRELFDNHTLETQYYKTLKAFTYNTKKRFDWFMKTNDTADGMMFRASEEGCDEKFFKK